MTRLSNRQYPMLRMFFDQGRQHYMNRELAQHYDNRPLISMIKRGYVVYRLGRGFVITDAGLQALHEFETTDIARKNPLAPLSKYFDEEAYGLKPVARAKVHVMKHKGAA